MKPSDFQLKDTYYFTAHSAFRSDEKFTVTKVESDYIVVQSDRPRFADNPMIVTDTTLAVYQDFGIKFTVRNGVKQSMFTEGEKAEMRHLMRKADEFIEKLPIGERIDFDALLEYGEIIEQGELPA